jgi:hypothetical protein
VRQSEMPVSGKGCLPQLSLETTRLQVPGEVLACPVHWHADPRGRLAVGSSGVLGWAAVSTPVHHVLSDILAPLVEADGGELYLVRLDATSLQVHLGCPGNSLVTEQVFKPALHRVAPALRLEVTSGPLLPEGSERIRPEGATVS